ncbi:MAG: hypothetical protein O3C45_02755 [Bacteroidetes bacterium]|nr:hypothetical protein [Bacteroidota bacterium]
MPWVRNLILIAALWGLSGINTSAVAQSHSVARQWNEALLQSIREDFARPTVHARNLFHTSVLMWDAWAAYDPSVEPYLLGNERYGFTCTFEGVPDPGNVRAAREKALSYAVYRLLRHRFAQSPNWQAAWARYDILMNELGYDRTFSSMDYADGDPAALGNYLADCMIRYGLEDGSNEQEAYANRHYRPVNPPLAPPLPGNPHILDLNRWQPLSFDIFIDQAGQEIPVGTPEFLGPEWGRVHPFSLTPKDLTIHERDGFEYWVYHDPGPPPTLDVASGAGLSDEYKWSHSLVAIWSSMLDPDDGVMWDISPARIGNIPFSALPRTIEGQRAFYDLFGGGDISQGWRLNPHTGEPYWAQVVPRGDYARVLAEFWADGPDSETPPGHWFTILNYVSDHPDVEKRFRGQGPVLDDLEWDIKSYFVLGGAMHDAAIAAWGAKGWYDYIRPISAIRGMAEYGQGSDPAAPRYHPAGIPLVPGYIEMVLMGDPLAGPAGEHLNKIKIRGWRGPQYVFNPETDEGGVDWVLAENWWPYQRPTFVTPPFAGYVSGHSTFSRAAAEAMTLLTGDPYFPGGMGEFVARKNEFLVFEEGPSVDVILQWATYQDASDQTSLSRIWGGIHPPADDIPGRIMGEDIGKEAFHFAERFISGLATDVELIEAPSEVALMQAYPNPLRAGHHFTLDVPTTGLVLMVDMLGRTVRVLEVDRGRHVVDTDGLAPGIYLLRAEGSTVSLILTR